MGGVPVSSVAVGSVQCRHTCCLQFGVALDPMLAEQNAEPKAQKEPRPEQLAVLHYNLALGACVANWQLACTLLGQMCRSRSMDAAQLAGFLE